MIFVGLQQEAGEPRSKTPCNLYSSICSASFLAKRRVKRYHSFITLILGLLIENIGIEENLQEIGSRCKHTGLYRCNEMNNEVSMLQAQLTEVHKRLSYWSNPDKIDNIEHLRQMEDILRESIERIRMHKENFGKHHLMPLECTSQFQNGIPLPMMIGGVQEAQPVTWLPNNDNQHMLLHNEPSFLSHRDAECSADGSFAGYSGFFGSGKQIEIGSSGQVDNVVQESSALNELGSNACLSLQLGEQYLYPPYSASNLQDDEKLKPEMEVNLPGNPAVYQVVSNFEIPRPMYNGGPQARISSSGPCGIMMFDGNSYHQ
ncbi:hypothetical protein SCA6_003995, partial [Theobroma cacao]